MTITDILPPLTAMAAAVMFRLKSAENTRRAAVIPSQIAKAERRLCARLLDFARLKGIPVFPLDDWDLYSWRHHETAAGQYQHGGGLRHIRVLRSDVKKPTAQRSSSRTNSATTSPSRTTATAPRPPPPRSRKAH